MAQLQWYGLRRQGGCCCGAWGGQWPHAAEAETTSVANMATGWPQSGHVGPRSGLSGDVPP